MSACDDVSFEWRKVGSKGENRMRFEIFNPNPEKEVVTRLRLSKVGGTIKLDAVDESGERIKFGNILAIRPNGAVHLFPSVNESIGLRLNDEGYIDVTK